MYFCVVTDFELFLCINRLFSKYCVFVYVKIFITLINYRYIIIV